MLQITSSNANGRGDEGMINVVLNRPGRRGRSLKEGSDEGRSQNRGGSNWDDFHGAESIVLVFNAILDMLSLSWELCGEGSSFFH